MAGPVLVVGATGQLGTAVVDRLAKARVRVRALVRPTSPREFATEGVELAFGDLREPESLVAACQGMATVVATANAVVPRVPGTFDEVEDTGYSNLLDACRAEDVRRIVFMSVVETPFDKSVTTFRLKRRTEEKIQGSGLRLFDLPRRLLHGRLVRADGLDASTARRAGGDAETALLVREGLHGRRRRLDRQARNRPRSGRREDADTRPSRSTTSRRSSPPRRPRPRRART